MQLEGLLWKSLCSMHTVGGAILYNSSASQLQTLLTRAKSESNSVNFDTFQTFQQKMGNKGMLKKWITFKVAPSTRYSNTFIYIPARFLLLSPAAWPCPSNHRITETACLVSFHPPDINSITLFMTWIYSCTKKCGQDEMESINRNTSL